MEKRIVVRVLLLISFFISAIAVIYALKNIEENEVAAWSALAAALAVITAVISAYSSNRVLELQEDNLQPEVYMCLDFSSRYGLVQLRVTNNGGGIAYNVDFEWRNEILRKDGSVVSFPHNEGTPEIPVLVVGQSLSIPIGSSIDFMQQDADLNYSGKVIFENSRGKKFSREFFISGEMYRKTLTYDVEDIRTHYELQKIPGELKAIATNLSNICNPMQKKPDI